MGFWIFGRKHEDLTDGRKVREPDLSEFVVPLFVNPNPIRKTDNDLVQRLKQEFIESGVINKEQLDGERELSDDEAEELAILFEEANLGALNERDFHDGVNFDENLYNTIDEYEQNDNRSKDSIVFADEVDDYGSQILELTSDYDDEEYY